MINIFNDKVQGVHPNPMTLPPPRIHPSRVSSLVSMDNLHLIWMDNVGNSLSMKTIDREFIFWRMNISRIVILQGMFLFLKSCTFHIVNFEFTQYQILVTTNCNVDSKRGRFHSVLLRN